MTNKSASPLQDGALPGQHRLMHCVDLSQIGGIEVQLVDFVIAAKQLAGWESDIVASGNSVHPKLMSRLQSSARLGFDSEARKSGPGWTRSMRRARSARWFRRQFEMEGADAALIWGELERKGTSVLKAVGEQRCIYWEHGAAWYSKTSKDNKWFIGNVNAVIANSHAAKRMLELRWGYSGQVRVILNALRPTLAPHVYTPRSSPGPVWRLGLASRLLPIKGVPLALHALASLRSQGYDVTLDIAGEGEDLSRLSELAKRLGIAGSVKFRGLVWNMADFYRGIDVLLQPSLREPFGQVVLEAHAYGVPTVVAAVDGLVESVADDVSGVCIAPTEALAVYGELGGTMHGIPEWVYYPNEDRIDSPRVLSPDRLASAIARLLEDEAYYEQLSRGAVERVATVFDHEKHVKNVLEALSSYLTIGDLHASARSSR